MDLGFVDTTDRKVRPKSELRNLVNFGSLERTDPIVNTNGTVHQTVEYMKKIVREHHGDMKKIADELYDERLSRFLRNIFNFVMTYVKYERDSAFTEQLRIPRRTLDDQRGDCDCMSILIGSILYNKGIPFYFRVSKYDANNDFSHVYVVVPRNDMDGYYVVDPVIKTFDKEKPFVEKKDYLMDGRLSGFSGLNGIPIQLLNGVDGDMGRLFSRAKKTQPKTVAMVASATAQPVAMSVKATGQPVSWMERTKSAVSARETTCPNCGFEKSAVSGGFYGFYGFYGLYGNLMSVTLGADLEGFGLGSAENDETAMYNYLVRTRDVILAAPQMFKIMKNPLEVARMLDYAIRYWNTPQIDHVLGILENEEQRLIREGVIVYPHADLSGDELGELSAGFFKKVGNAVKKGTQAVGKGVTTAVKATGKAVTTAAKATGKGVATAAKATGKAVATAAKATGKAVARFNPVSLAARAGLLLAIKINLFKLADKLQYGLYTDEQAKAANFNMDDFHAMQESYNKSRNLFVNTLKGKEDKFKDAVSKGVKHKAINGLGELSGLGMDPATGSVVTAAMGFITSLLNFFKGKKNPKTGETFDDETVTEDQILDLLNQSAGYDEDGNPIDTTANPQAEKNFWDKASGILQTGASLITNFLPSGGGGSVTPYDQNDEYYQPVNNQDMIISPQSGNSSAVTANVMTGGMMSNVGAFFKKNAVLIGVGAAVAAGGIYFLTRKKKSRKGLSGVRTNPRPVYKRKTVKSQKPKFKRMKLS